MAITRQRGFSIDGLDTKLLNLMLSGLTNRQMADRVKKPLSTIQRRARVLVEKGLIKNTFELDYEKLGYKKGLLHIYLSDGNTDYIAEQVSKMNGILSVSIHLGNSDIVGEFLFKDSKEILDLISKAKMIEGVERTLWSEVVYTMLPYEGAEGLSEIIDRQ